MDEHTVFRKNNKFLLEHLDEEVLLFNPNSSRAMYLNQTSAVIWELIDGTRPVGEVIRLFSEAFPDNPDIGAEIESVLEEMIKNEALEQTDPPEEIEQAEVERRSLLQVLAASGASISARAASGVWLAPVIGTVVVPAHAVMTGPVS